MFLYKQSHEKSISDVLKVKFRSEVAALEREGFRFFCMHQEIIWPFSVVLFFPIYLTMASNEYVRIEPPLRITTYHLMYVSAENATLAYVYGLGCKFYTQFADGAWLVSNTVQNSPDQKVTVLPREPGAVTTEQAWQRHRAKLQELQARGKQPATQISFEQWVELESRFDRSNVTSMLSMGFVWMVVLAWVISWGVTYGWRILQAIF